MNQTVPNPVKPVIVTIIGLTAGILSMVYAYFHTGHIPSGAEISGLLGGAGITLTSVVGFLVHHLGVNKALIQRDIAGTVSQQATNPAALPQRSLP